MRKKTGNLIVALCILAISLGLIVLSYFYGPVKDDRTFLEMVLNKEIGSFTDVFSNFNFAGISKFYIIALVLPLLTSIFALIFKRRRFTNLLNVIGWTITICILLYPVRYYSNVAGISIFDYVKDSVTIPYMAMCGISAVAFIGSIVNTELCR